LRAGAGLGAALLLAFWKPVLAAIAAALALLLLGAALLSPSVFYPRVERWLAAFAQAVAVGVTWLVLVPVHVLVFLPLGLLLRAAGRLRLDASLDPAAATYWHSADGADGADGEPRSHERQF
jgi:hypothetical protein